MKKYSLIFIAFLSAAALKSQIANLTTYPEYPNSENVVHMSLNDIGLDKQLLISETYNKHPNLKGSKYWTVNSIVNASDFSKINEVENLAPMGDYEWILFKDKNYERESYNSDTKSFTINKSIYRTVLKNEKSSKIFLQHAFQYQGKLAPEKLLFTLDDKNALDDFSCYSSVGHKVIVYSYCMRNKKVNKNSFIYWVYNEKFDLLKSDSIISTYSKENNWRVYPYETGYVLADFSVDKVSFIIKDLANNQSLNFEVANEFRDFRIKSVKQIQGNKLIILGDYFDKKSKRNIKYGVCKFVYNLKSNKLEESIFYDRKLEGTYDSEEKKVIYSYEITNSGECYVLVAQQNGLIGTAISYVQFEIFYLNNNSSCWKKQLHIASSFGAGTSTPHLFKIGDVPYILYNYRKGDKEETVDINNYIFGSPYPYNYDLNQSNLYDRSNMILLKFSADSEIKRQIFPDISITNIIVKDNEALIVRKKGGHMSSSDNLMKLTFEKK